MNEWMLTKRKNFRHWSGLWQWHGRITAFYYPSFIQNSNLKAVLFLKNPLFCPLYLGRLSYYLPVYSQSICTPRKYEFCVHFTWMHQHFVRADSPFSGGVNRMKVLNQKHKHGFNELQQFQELNPLLPIILKSSLKIGLQSIYIHPLIPL